MLAFLNKHLIRIALIVCIVLGLVAICLTEW